jgi:4-amino-4-deoxy-L-arabinose transferase-like glycosyltransferase
VLALTPVATLMFRFNNPDALLMLVLTAAAYAVLRAIEDGRTRWLLLAGALVGLGFLTKQLQAVLVLPTFGVAYLVAAPKAMGRRILDLLAAFAAMIGAAGWWIAIVELVPAAVPAVRRRLAEQQHSRAHLRLQRSRPADRRRDGQRRRGGGGGRRRCGARPACGRMFNSRWAARSPG